MKQFYFCIVTILQNNVYIFLIHDFPSFFACIVLRNYNDIKMQPCHFARKKIGNYHAIQYITQVNRVSGDYKPRYCFPQRITFSRVLPRVSLRHSHRSRRDSHETNDSSFHARSTVAAVTGTEQLSPRSAGTDESTTACGASETRRRSRG